MNQHRPLNKTVINLGYFSRCITKGRSLISKWVLTETGDGPIYLFINVSCRLTGSPYISPVFHLCYRWNEIIPMKTVYIRIFVCYSRSSLFKKGKFNLGTLAFCKKGPLYTPENWYIEKHGDWFWVLILKGVRRVIFQMHMS